MCSVYPQGIAAVTGDEDATEPDGAEGGVFHLSPGNRSAPGCDDVTHDSTEADGWKASCPSYPLGIAAQESPSVERSFAR